MRIVAFFALLCSCTFCFADLTLTQQDGTSSSNTYLSQNRSASRDSLRGVIIDFGKMTITFINLQDSTYCTSDIQEYSHQTVQYVRNFADQKREELINKVMGMGHSREEATQLLQAYLTQAMQDSTLTLPVETVRGDSKTIAGFSADSYLLKQSSHPVRLIWVSRDLLQRVNQEIDSLRYKKVNRLMRDTEIAIQNAFSGCDSIPQGTLDTAQEKLEHTGYLMATMEIVGDEMVNSGSKIEEISTAPIDPAIFQVPNGFHALKVEDMVQRILQLNE